MTFFADSCRSRDDMCRTFAPALCVIASFILALFAQGCATTPDSGEIHTNKEYRTGSNIPVRDPSSPSDSKSYDPASVQDALRSSPPMPPRGLRGG